MKTMAHAKRPGRTAPRDEEPEAPEAENLMVRGLPAGTLAALDAWAMELRAEYEQRASAAGLAGRHKFSRNDLLQKIIREALEEQRKRERLQ